MTKATEAQTQRKSAVINAAKAWDSAPLTIRAMAGQYVLPMLAAIGRISEELDALQEQQKGGNNEA